jgi:transcriptional regulator with XRE-family HTH domain
MGREHESGQKSPRMRGQRWGPIIRTLREEKGWSRTVLLGVYMNKLEARKGEAYDHHEVPLDSWLSRAENGRNVTATREHIEVLCEALDCSPEQRWEILDAAGLNPFADTNGTLSAEDKFFQRTLTLLSNSRRARRVLEHYSLKHENALRAAGEEDLELLLEVVQAALEEKARKRGEPPQGGFRAITAQP